MDDLEKQYNTFYVTSSFVHHLVAIFELKLELQSANTQLWSKSPILCDLEIWRMTLKNNMAHLLCHIKIFPPVHCHMWIQTGFTVWKRLNRILESVTLTFDRWPLHFAWTSLMPMVITPENVMAKRWWEHSEKGVTDGQTERSVLRAASYQLKTAFHTPREIQVLFLLYIVHGRLDSDIAVSHIHTDLSRIDKLKTWHKHCQL